MIPLPGAGQPGPRATAVRRAGLAVAAVVGCGVVLGAAAGFAGSFGLVIAADCLAGLALLLLASRIPEGSRGRRPASGTARQPAAAGPAAPGSPAAQHAAGAAARAVAGWFRQRMRRRQPVTASGFPAFLKISSDLGWASVSRWHYDHGTRRLMTRIMQAALAERHRLDPAADPARARELAGEDVWPFLDPAAPPCHDSQVPGPDLRTLTRIVERLERL